MAHRAGAASPSTGDAYEAFLREIGYLEPEGDAFSIDTTKIDPRDRDRRGPAAGGADHQLRVSR